MTLNKQLLPISFFKGIDNKSDNKNSVPGDILVAENAIFTNPGKFKKRNGFSALPTLSNSGNISIGKAISSYNNEPVVFTDNEVLGFSETEQLWLNRGTDYSLSSEVKSVVNNNSQQKNPEHCIADGLEVYVWEDSSAGVRYSVIDHANGSVLIANALVDSFGSRPKVLFWNNAFQITYVSNYQIYFRNINPLTPFIISDGFLFDTPVLNSLDPTGPQYDLSIDGYGYLTIAYAYVNNSTIVSTVDSSTYKAITSADVNVKSEVSIGLFVDASNFTWLLSGSAAGGFNVGGVFSPVFYNPQIDGYQRTQPINIIPIRANDKDVVRCMGYQNLFSGNIIIVYEVEENQNFDNGNTIYKAILGPVQTGAKLFLNSIFKRGLGLYSKGFKYNTDYFFELTYNTPLQATYYLFNEAGVVVTRTNINNGGGSKNDSDDGKHCGMCTNIAVSNSTTFAIPFQFKTTIQSNNNVTYLPTGVNVGLFDFGADNVFQNVFSSSTLNVVGGIFQNYDGSHYVENNFLVYPENITAYNAAFITAVTTPGNSTTKEVIEFVFTPGYQIAPNTFFTFSSTTANYFAWFRVDGVGNILTPPAGNELIIDINHDFTATDVANAFAAAVSVFDFGISTFENAVILTNSGRGASLSAPTTGNVNTGSIGDGTYLYSVIYSWVDNNGIVQNGETSVPISITTSVGTTSAHTTIVVPTLRITNKSNVKINIYRTEGTNQGSTIYYRITPPGGIVSNPSVDWTYFIDTSSDSSILANDLLYTTGGVLDNTAPPASTMLALYKNRIFINDSNDGNLLWFTKYIFEGIPTQFSEFLTLKVDAFGGDITALGVLDDKLIIFKESAIFALVGNGPSDTGGNNDYDSGMVRISTDVGCSNVNSIVITPVGLMFRSAKGIYLLGRDLSTHYIGANVEDYNSLGISSAVLSPNNNQVRFTTSDGAMLVYDYFVKQWATFTGLEGADAHFIGQTYYLLRNNGQVYKEDLTSFDDNGAFIKLKIKTGWINIGGIQGFQRVWRAAVLGTYYGPHHLLLSFGYNYQETPSQFTNIDATTVITGNEPWGSDGYWGELGTVWGGSFVPYEFRVHLTEQKCTTIQIIIEDILDLNTPNQSYDISNLNLEVGIKNGANKLPSRNSFGNK